MITPRIFKADGVVVQVPQEVARYGGHASGRLTAYQRGARAAARGTPRDRCPYASERGAGSFRLLWQQGHDAWHAAKAAQPQESVA